MSSSDLISQICRQIDYYFCDYNLHSGVYMRKKLEDPGYITLDELMKFRKICELSNDSIEIVEKSLREGTFELAHFDPETKHISLRKDKTFNFQPKFWRRQAYLSVYLLSFPDEFDPSKIQQAIPGVAFVRFVKDIKKNIICNDESLDESFNTLNLSDSIDDSPQKSNSKKKPHAILYFKDEKSMKSLLKSCGEDGEFYFENNNKKCYILPRSHSKIISEDVHNGKKKKSLKL